MNFSQGIITGLLCLVICAALWRLLHCSQTNDYFRLWKNFRNILYAYFKANPFPYHSSSIQSNGQYPVLVQKAASFSEKNTQPFLTFCKSIRGTGPDQYTEMGNSLLLKFPKTNIFNGSFLYLIPGNLLRLIGNLRFLQAKGVTIAFLLLSLGISNASWGQSASATYSSGNISTDIGFQSLPGSSSCPVTLTVGIPAGAVITGVDVEYRMTGIDAWMSDQRSQLRCTSTGGTSEATLSLGVGNNTGTYNYSRTGLTIANGVTGGGNITFQLHAGRTWGGTGCGTNHTYVNNNTWKVTVYYTLAGYCSGNAISVVSSSGVPNPGSSLATDNVGAQLHETNDQITLELTSGDLLTALGTVNVIWNRTSNSNTIIHVEISSDGSLWTAAGDYTNIARNTWTTQSIPLSINTRYIRFTSNNGYDLDLDAVSFNTPCAPPCTTPSGTVTPTPQTICVGSPVTFNVTATGTPAPTYQWRKGGVTNIPGATNATYTIAAVAAGDAGFYDVWLTNSCASTSTTNFGQLIVTPTVGTPVFTLGTSSTRCQGAGSVTYTATATNSTGMTYSLDAASITGGNSIIAGTGVVTYVAGWSGTSVITASAAGCNGPKTATHTVTITPTVGTPVFTIGGSSTRCQGAGSVTYTAAATNSTGMTYSLDAASITGGNSIVAGTGVVTYVAGWSGTSVITASAAGCNGPTTSNHTVTITPTVGTPVFTIGGSSTRCQGAGSVTYTAAATNSTGMTYSLDAASITGGNSIVAGTGVVTYVAGWSGTSIITASAAGCNGPKTATHTVTITPTVGTPVFTLGASSTRCQGAGSVTYTATATNSTGMTYSLDAASITGGNSIIAGTGVVTYVAGWSGTSVITASAAGCNGPKTATHTVTITPTVGTPVFTIGGSSTRCQGAGSVTYTAAATNSTGMTYSLDAASITGGNSIVAGTGVVTYVAGWSGTSVITASAAGCNGPTTSNHTVTITPTVGTPVFTIGGSSTRCQGAGSVTYTAAATNSTGMTYSLDAASITGGNSIVSATGVVTYVAGWSGTSIITASAAGCNGPKTATHTVTITPTVGTPVFTLGSSSTRCQGAGSVTYTAAATNSTGMTYSLDAASITGGNSIVSATGVVTYVAGWSGTSIITASAAGCNGPKTATHTVTITPTVGTPVFTLGSSSTRCQGAGSVTYTAAATNSTGMTYSLDAASITGGNSIVSGTGVVTYVAGWSGTSIITASAAGCNGPKTATHTVTITPTVGTPVFTLGASSTRCQGAGSVTYTATATNSTGMTYSLDAASITGGNSIIAGTGVVTYVAGWSGTSVITASAAGCNGPKTATHTVTITPTVGTPVFTIGGSSTRCQGAGSVTYTAAATNSTGMTYSLDAASITGGNSIVSATGVVTYVAGWSGTSIITASAAGCNGPKTATHTVTITPTVGTPVFTLGASSTRCQGAGSVTYTAAATNSTGMTYSLDAASITGGNSIVAGTGVVTYVAGWSGTSVITASAAGCNGPKTSNHTVTINPLVGISGLITGSIFVTPATTGLVYSISAIVNATTYTWAVPTGWTILSGQGTTSVTVKSGTALQDGNITVTAENSCGTSAASILAVQVDPALTIITQPVDQNDCLGNAVIFNVITSGGTAPLSYTWQRNTGSGFSNISGDPDITKPTVSSIQVADVGSVTNPNLTQYQVIVTDAGAHTVTSTIVTLTVDPTSVGGTVSSDATVCSGSNGGTLTLNGQIGNIIKWQSSTDNFASNSVDIANTSTSQTYTNLTQTTSYRAVAKSGVCPAVNSGSALITVNLINAGVIDKGVLNPGPACAPLNPNLLLSTTDATGSGVITYAWEQSTDGQATWQTASGTTTTGFKTLNPDPMNVPTSLRRLATSVLNGVSCSAYSNALNYVVWPLPVVASILPGGAIPDICVNSTKTFINATPGGIWSTTNASIAIVSGGIVTGVSAGTATISYTVTDGNGCSKTANRTVHIIGLPVISASATSFCMGNTINLSPTTGGTWVSNNTSIATVTNAGLVNSVAPGNVTFTFTDLVTGCSSTTTNITVNPLPVPTITGSPVACAGSSGNIYTTESGMSAYLWNVSAGGTITAGSGTNSVTVTWNTFSPQTISVNYTNTNNCTAATSTVLNVTVNQLPVVTATPAAQTICSEDVTAIALTSNIAGTTYSWTVTQLPLGSITGAISGSGSNIAQTLQNLTANVATVTYSITPTANGCPGTPITVAVTVRPKPTLTNTPPPDICSNSLFSFIPTSGTVGTTFTWRRDPILGILPASGSGADNPNETLTNISSSPIDVIYVYTLAANGCYNTQNVVVRVLPDLTLSSSLTPQVCSNSLFNYTATSTLPVSFNWVRASVAGISNPSATGTVTISETLVNTTAANVDVPYIFTLNIGTCANIQTVTVTVKPSPVLSGTTTPTTICNNTAFIYTPASTTSGTTFNWTRLAVPGISNPGFVGTNGVNEVLNNTTANPVVVTYEYKLRATGCETIQNILVTVNPTPILSSSLTPPAICNNSVFGYTASSTTSGTGFSWNRAAVAGISNPVGSGTGNISETLTNTTANPINVSYVYRLAANGCTNTTTETVVVTVNPLPTITVTPVSTTICRGTTAALAASGAVSYKWSSGGIEFSTTANVTVSPTNTTTYTVAGTDANGCVNTTTVTVTVLQPPTLTISPNAIICSGGTTTLTAGGANTYSWSPSTGLSSTTGTSVFANPASTTTYTVTGTDGNGCTNTATVTVIVNPLPTITVTPASPSICAGSTVTLTASGAVGYEWSPSADLSSATGGTVIAAPATTTTYAVIGTDGDGCVNTFDITVTVKPLPILNNPTPSPATICSNTQFNFSPISSIAGTSFTWSRAVVAGISNPSSFGTGNISESLVNTTSNNIPVTYIYTLTADGCTNPVPFYVTIVVIPAPTVNAFASSTAICAGQTASLTSNSSLVALNPVILTEDFESAAVGATSGPNGWTTSHNSTFGVPANAYWTVRQSGYNYDGDTYRSNDNSKFYFANSDAQGGSSITSEILQSPAFSTVGYTTLQLDFWQYFRYNSGERGYVEVSSDNWVTSTAVLVNNASIGNRNPFNNHQIINISSFINKPSVKIRFRYEATWDWYWGIDNITVSGTSANNATVEWTSFPAGFSSTVANPGAVSPAVTTTYFVTYTDPTADPSKFCPGTNSVTVTVNPKPVMTSTNSATICSGGTVSISLTADVPSTYTWVAASNTNVAGESTTNQSTSILNNTLTNSTASTQTVVYTVTPTSIAGCVGTPQTVNVTVNPIPNVTQPTSQTLCSSASTNAINFSSAPVVAGTIYNWTNDTPSIGLASSGTGNIPSFTAINNGSSMVTATIVVTPVVNGCPGTTKTFTISVRPLPAPVIDADYCKVPGKIRLTVTGATPGSTFLWSNGMTANPIDVDIASSYSVSVTDPNCGLLASILLPVSNELVVNGNFTNTNLVNPAVDFTTGYVYKRDLPGLVPATQGELWDDSGNNGYSITTDGQNVHANFWGRDKTNNSTGSRNFMAVNGHGTIIVWQQTVTVLPNTNYYYSAWGMNLNWYNPAKLQFRVNGVNIGTIADLNVAEKPTNDGMVGLSNWVRFYYGSTNGWFSGASTTAIIQIVDLNSDVSGNDFGLDDISFGTLDPIPGVIVPSVAPGPICQYGNLQLLANRTSTKPPFTYAWTGPNGFTSDQENPVITNISSLNSGTYSLTFTDGYGCATLYGSVTVTVSASPVCSITGTSVTVPNATDIFTAPASMATYVWSVSGSGTIVGASNSVTVSVKAGATCTSTYTVSLLVTNANGCTSTCTQLVSLNDNTAPVVVGTLSATTIQGCVVADAPAPATTVAALEALQPGFTINDTFTPKASIVVTSTDVSSGSCPITVIRTYKVTDACSNYSTFSHTIIIQDTTKPVVSGTLSPTVVQGCSVASVFAPATTVAQLEALSGSITITDNCTSKASLTVSSTETSSGTCPIVLIRTYTVADACGNSVTMTQTITIQDTTPPVVTGTLSAITVQGCSVAAVPAPVSTVAQLEALTGSITISDACTPKASLTVSSTEVSSGVGTCSITVTRTYTVKDACNNGVPIVQVITIVDTTPPVWTTLAGALNQFVECGDVAELAAANALIPSATDNCGLTLTLSKISGVLVAGGAPCTQAGTYSNTFTMTDACGNISAVYTQLITLEDNTPPNIIAPPVAVILCTDIPNPSLTGTATASDNCGTVSITYSDALPVVGTCAGSTKIVRTWKATDSCGNSSTAQQNILTQDVFPPTITTQAQNQTVECDGSGNVIALNNWLAAHGGAVATDACGAVNWTNNFTTLSDLCGSTGAAIVTFTAADDCGNSSTTQATFTITDTQKPVISCPAPASGTLDTNECFSTTVVLGMATATDNCSTVSITNDAPAQFAVGTTNVVWTATDACGNSSSCTQIVTVTDNNQAPTVICPGNQSQSASAGNCSLSNVIIPDPTTADNCAVTRLIWSMGGATSGNSPATGINSVSGQTFNVGTTTVTYTAFDAAGNSASCSFTVTILDVTPPSLTVGGCANVSESAASNNCSKIPVTITDPSYSDNCWGTASLTLTYTMTGATTDSGTGSVVGRTFNVGVTTVTYTVTDPDGNYTNCSFTVTILDVTPPSLTVGGCVNVSESAASNNCSKIPVTITDPSYSDNCWGTASLTLTYTMTGATIDSGTGSVVGRTFNVGVTTVTYTVTDPDGNYTNCSFTVTILDVTPPSLTVGGCVNVSDVVSGNSCSAIPASLVDPTYSDNCYATSSLTLTYSMTGATTGSGTGSVVGRTFNVGVTTVTYTVSDPDGNSDNCSFTVTIHDVTPPAIAVGCVNVSESISGNGCSVVPGTIQAPTLTDNCWGTSSLTLTYTMTGTTTGSGNGSVVGVTFNAGLTTVTYTVSDPDGNSSTCTFTVTIIPLNPPQFSTGCPPNPAPVSVTAPNCDAAVSIAKPTVNDPCSVGYVVTNSFNNTNDASDTYPIGITTVTWTITPTVGPITTCTQTVTVNDLPLKCPGDITTPADNGKTYASNVTVPPPTYSSGCSGLTLIYSMVKPDATIVNSAVTGVNEVSTPGQFDVGVTTITYTLTHADGAVESCFFTITVTSEPKITCATDILHNVDPLECNYTTDPGAPILTEGAQPITWTWVIDGPSSPSEASGTFLGSVGDPGPPAIGSHDFKVGTSTITWTATNVSGSATCQQLVTVVDNEVPTFTMPSALSECVENIISATYDPNTIDILPARPDYYIFGANNPLLDITGLTDNCCGTASMTINWRIDFDGGTPASITGTGQLSSYGSDIQFPGDTAPYDTDLVHTITYWVVDCHGNTSPTQTQNITIKPRPNIIKAP